MNTEINPMQTTASITNNKRMTYLSFITGLSIGLFVGAIITVQFTQRNVDLEEQTQAPLNKNTATSEIEQQLLESSDNLVSKHYISATLKGYENTRLGYKIEYPRDITNVYDCPDSPCSSIDEFTIRFEPLSFYGRDEILKDDLWCSADGPMGSAYCENPQISEFTNSNGINGFVIKRTKIVEAKEYANGQFKGTKVEQFNDTVYIFPLNDSSTDKAVLISADTPSEQNLAVLDRIANSFELTK